MNYNKIVYSSKTRFRNYEDGENSLVLNASEKNMLNLIKRESQGFAPNFLSFILGKGGYYGFKIRTKYSR